MDELITVLVPLLSPWILLLVLFLYMPEKVETWFSILLKVISKLKVSFHRRYVTHDLQGRVNGFVRGLRKQVPGLAIERLRLDWVDPNMPRKAFIDDDRIVLRLRRDDPHDHNFVHGAYLFVSQGLLGKPKRYISPSQRQALDIFVCGKLIEEEKPAVRSVFIDEYLHPYTANPKSKIGQYVDDFASIDDGALFFPVLLQELDYLGDKVFGRRKSGVVIKEVDELIDFLKPIATRVIGEENDLTCLWLNSLVDAA